MPKSFQAYRFSLGLVGENVPAEKLERARKTYRKGYLKRYCKAQKKYKVQRKLTFTKKQDALLIEIAKRYGKTPSGFIRACALSYIGEPLPNITEIATLLCQIRKIGNNINQITRRFHNDSSQFDSSNIFEQLATLEMVIVMSLTTCPNKSIRAQIRRILF